MEKEKEYKCGYSKCNRTFERLEDMVRRKTYYFCSPSCAMKAYWEMGLITPQVRGKEFLCQNPECNVKFWRCPSQIRNGKYKHCSQACYTRDVELQKSSRVFTCKNASCGKMFRNYKNPNAKYCTAECYYEDIRGMKRPVKGESGMPRVAAMEECRCAYDKCGKTFIRNKKVLSRVKKAYCSQACRFAALILPRVKTICCNPECKIEFETTQSKLDAGLSKYCTSECWQSVIRQKRESGTWIVGKKMLCSNPACGKEYGSTSTEVYKWFGEYCSWDCYLSVFPEKEGFIDIMLGRYDLIINDEGWGEANSHKV